MKTQLYFAYGSNLAVDQMQRRCPKALPLHRVVINDWKLVFRGVADVIQSPGDKLYGGVWRITKECEHALDIYEGVASGLYYKAYFKLNGEDVLVYLMNSHSYSPPSTYYADVIKQGYDNFDLPQENLAAAIKESYEKAPKPSSKYKYYPKEPMWDDDMPDDWESYYSDDSQRYEQKYLPYYKKTG